MMSDRKHLRHARATPLASIFGSGFLVIVPILNAAVGPYSLVAMAGVCALPTPWVQSSVSIFATWSRSWRQGQCPLATARWERTANLALVLAYAISVASTSTSLPLSSWVDSGINTPRRENIVTVIVIAAIGVLGGFRGLDMLMVMERWALRSHCSAGSGADGGVCGL